MPNFAALLYLVASILFILALRGLSSPASSLQGARYGMTGMGVAIFATLAHGGPSGFSGWLLAIVGIGLGGGVGATLARRIEMTKAPQLVALFPALVGLAIVQVAAAALYAPLAFGIGAPGAIHRSSLLQMALAAALGAIACAGSLIAAARLDGRMPTTPIVPPQRQRLIGALAGLLVLLTLVFITSESHFAFVLLALVALAIGGALIVPVGLADMPIVASMLSSCAGWALAATGFALGNIAMIIAGALVGSSGAFLCRNMCKAMDRPLSALLLGGQGADEGAAETRPVKRGSAEDAAYIMQNASNVVIIPGYGMAAADAQHIVREMADLLKKRGVAVTYAIHPAAGRTPGQINALLAEAGAPADEVIAPDDINARLEQADVAFVIGANDVANPDAKTGANTALSAMPTLDVEKARTVLVVKRGMGAGYAGVENELFFRDNATMLFGDARKVTEAIVKSLGR